MPNTALEESQRDEALRRSWVYTAPPHPLERQPSARAAVRATSRGHQHMGARVAWWLGLGFI